uniref:Putative glycoside hydrolase n=1 Tax=viral metagenome TaxID=1070528 RepID=A0A6M3IWW5_9ZZZZ
MADFNVAIKTIMEHEGGYTVDHAGATNYGIILATLRRELDWDGDGFLDGDLDRDGDIDADDIRLLTPDKAKAIYRRQWWDRYSYWAIPNDAVATKIFDLAVNAGPSVAGRVAQRAVLACDGTKLVQDGQIGPITRKAIGGILPKLFVTAYRSEMAGFYRTLIAKRPDFKKYETGWLRRAYS